jgi:hypothetical protein
VQVAVGADDAPCDVQVRQVLQQLAHVLAAALDRRERLDVGQVDEDALDLLVDVGGQQRERLRARLLGDERRVRALRAERGVQIAGHRAERPEVAEQPLGVRGEPLERELPAVPGVGQVLLQDAERRVEQPALVLVPARQRGDVREAALGQEAQQLELGVHARLHAPERLEDQLVAEDHRGVGLLDADRPDVDGPAAAGVRGLRPAEAQRRVLAGDLGVVVPHAVQQLASVRRIDERVVDRPAVELGDDALGPALVGRPQPERQLVDLVRALAEARLDEQQDQLRRLLAQLDRLGDVDLGHLARLGAEPAPGDHPVVQRLLVES